MTERITGTGVTQTWQVGPRRQRRFSSGNEGDIERTQTLRRERVSLRIESLGASESLRRQELSTGVNSFWLDETQGLRHQTQKRDKSEFEIEVNEAGSFYFGFSKAKLNGRRSAWSRLRSGDEIELNDWRLTVEGAIADDDRTVIVDRQGQQRSAGASTKSPRSKKKRTTPILRILLGSLIIGSGTLVGWSYLGTAEQPIRIAQPTKSLRQAPVEVGSSATSLSPALVPAPQREEPAPGGQTKSFEKADFELALAEFRAGKKTRGCEALKRGAKTRAANIWSKKAALFVSRRCGG